MTHKMTHKLEKERLDKSLKQLIVAFEPYIRDAGSVERAEEALLHLEENDENFHRYEFVRYIRHKIDEYMGSLLSAEIGKRSITPDDIAMGQEPLLTEITNHILNSQQYVNLRQKLKSNIEEAVATLLDNFEEELGPGARQHQRPSSPKRKECFSDEESSSFASSFNQSSFMFMSQEQFLRIAEKLENKKNNEGRSESLHSLLQIPAVDVQNSESWPQIKRGLLDALNDTDHSISDMALRFCARAFSSSSPATRDVYTLLMDYLTMQFNFHKKNLPKVKNGVDVNTPEIAKIMKALRLMNEYQQQIPQVWVRYPERFVTDVIEGTLSLLSIRHSSPVGGATIVTPIHLLAILDPEALWFVKWMHGSYSRFPLLEILHKYRPVVENAVRQCLEVVAARKVPFDLMSDISDTMSKVSVDEGRRMYYTGPELEYLYFIHSVSLLSRLICYANGRSFFPIRINEEPVTMTKLLVSLVQLIIDPGGATTASKSPSAWLDPAVLVRNMFRLLCSSGEMCHAFLCKDDITNALLAPISQWLDAATEGSSHIPSEASFLHIADILSLLACSNVGRQHLLYGQTQDRLTRSKSCAAYILSQFVQQAISGDLPVEYGAPPSNAVIGSLVYVCRQLYSTCEGLFVLYPYDLHSVIAQAWKVAYREVDNAATPTPDDHSSDFTSGRNKQSQNIHLWEDMLRDNLLNFAGTPKGLLLLQQTGAINDCVSYMYSRYERKLQVSKCEKFGYGMMVTQVAATAAGMVALQNTGFLTTLIGEIWEALECSFDDSPVFTPRPWPVDHIDRYTLKHLLKLVNVLSAFPAVYEVLADQPLPSKDSYSFREPPTTIPEMLDRLMFVNTDAQIHSLFNYEQSHVFGLRVLSMMTSCLDTFLLLQSQYKFQEILLSCQETGTLEESNDIIIDMLSVERNYVLVRTYLVGGPSERILPSRTLQQDGMNPYPQPIFSSYPVPREYIPNIAGRSALKQEHELSRFLMDSKKSEQNVAWLEKCRRAMCNILTTRPEYAKGNVLQELLERVAPVLSHIPEEAIFPASDLTASESAIRGYQLSPLQLLGIKLAVRYGMHLKLCNSSSDATENLTYFHKQLGLLFKDRQKTAIKSDMRTFSGQNYPGFDWFASTIFLLMNGNRQRAWKFVQTFSTLAVSAYIWPPRIHASHHLPSSLKSSGVSPLFSSTGHNIELLLQIELPLIKSAFQMSGYTPSQICLHWLGQCFWNYLDWLDICHYICVCTVLGVDYQVYMCVAILHFLQQDILQNQQHHQLLFFLKEEPIRGFHVGEHLEYMQSLEKKFRRTILPDMLAITKP